MKYKSTFDIDVDTLNEALVKTCHINEGMTDVEEMALFEYAITILLRMEIDASKITKEEASILVDAISSNIKNHINGNKIIQGS